jgi:hypothetical protein
MGSLTISRDPATWTDRARDYIILIDDQPVGGVGHGDAVTVPLAPGPHRVRMKIDWCGSNELLIDGAEDTRLRCWLESGGMLTMFFNPRGRIGLEAVR